MTDAQTGWTTHLQRRAAHCRRLAGAASSPGIAEELLSLARSYEDELVGLFGGGREDHTAMPRY